MPNFKVSRPNMEWRSIASLPGYEVSEYGHLRRIVALLKHSKRYPVGREHSYGLAGKGYAFYNVIGKSKRKNVYAHSLVAEAFIGPKPDGMEVAHNDGNKLNCHFSNLRYATSKENNFDKIAHGTHNARDKNPMVKLTTNMTNEIKALADIGMSQDAIGKHFSVSQTTVGRFLRQITA